MTEWFVHNCGVCGKQFYCMPNTPCHGNKELRDVCRELCICSECSYKYKLEFLYCKKGDSVEELTLCIL